MRFFKLISIVALLTPALAQAQLEGVTYNWKEKKNKDGISISTSSVEGSAFKAVKGEMTVEASVASLYALVEDMQACPDWAAMCKESRIEERISDSETYVYVYNDIPFPVRDRDVYTHVVWTLDSETGSLSMTSTASEGGTEKTRAVRIENAVSQWHFTPLGEGMTKVENFGHIDPNGPTPAWLTNMMLLDAPYKSMSNMREIVESGGYADAVLPME